mgnify:FL=1
MHHDIDRYKPRFCLHVPNILDSLFMIGPNFTLKITAMTRWINNSFGMCGFSGKDKDIYIQWESSQFTERAAQY